MDRGVALRQNRGLDFYAGPESGKGFGVRAAFDYFAFADLILYLNFTWSHMYVAIPLLLQRAECVWGISGAFVSAEGSDSL